MNIFAQFSDDTKTTIIGYFSSPQDPEAYHYQDRIDTSDTKWQECYSGLNEIVQRDLPAPT